MNMSLLINVQVRLAAVFVGNPGRGTIKKNLTRKSSGGHQAKIRQEEKT
jgi:hypothetical protein